MESDTTRNFICGVVEGFYGRPWTPAQRKDLFRKLKVFGMNSYVYAPKDDYKHRAYWRELYTVEEADHLAGLISAAKEQNINFYYALSPGLDIQYSNPKEISFLKRKLDQVSRFGCEAFALLFDDIESEISKSDKEIFQSFAHAQVSVANDIYIHLGQPKFLFCPTQYCSSRAVPTVTQSEYLGTLGSKLDKKIDILWTGNKVISKFITPESMQEITEVLKRLPVIWDNLHANDYDPKRVFLGPYCNRSPELIPLLGGVLTNPNCEFHANTIAIHTLASWSKCKTDTKVSNSISADIKLETENEDGTFEDTPAYLTENTYHPRLALKNAILDWLPEFFQEKQAFGPIVKPHPPVTMVLPITPIIPSIMQTCMVNTTTTCTSTVSSNMSIALPEINASQLQTLADVAACIAPEGITTSIMNSLVSPTKVITTEAIPHPILATSVSTFSLPHAISSVQIHLPKEISCELSLEDLKQEDEPIIDAQIENNEDIEKITPSEDITEKDALSEPENKKVDDQMSVGEDVSDNVDAPNSEPMECGSGVVSPKHQIDQNGTKNSEKTKNLVEDVIMIETTSSNSNSMQVETSSEVSMTPNGESLINLDDILLLCDLFYLPFQHGSQALQLLNEYYWLKTNAGILSGNVNNKEKPQVQEWFRRHNAFLKLCELVLQLAKKIAVCANRELCYDLYTYVWEISSVISLHSAYVRWLALGFFPTNINSYTQGSYTWFSKGWKEVFMSGDQEPWVFRGGLMADLQRLIPVDSANDLFVYKLPETPTTNFYSIRPYVNADKREVYAICHKTCRDGTDCTELFPEDLQEIAVDRLIAPFVTITPEFCMVVEDSNKMLVGYACAALNAKTFYGKQEICWIPEMMKKYPISLLDSQTLTPTAKDSITHFHNFKYDCPQTVQNTHPSIMSCCVLNERITNDQSVCKRLISVLLAALRSNGSFGVHACINSTDHNMHQFYAKLGFTDIFQDDVTARLYLGRNF